jgi:N-formylglutamate deformylase
VNWLTVVQGDAPLIVTFPHTGTDLADVGEHFASPWLARRDADWWVDQLYAFAQELGATTVRTRISRSVIDTNRDPSGASLYPGQITTELCPTTSFAGQPLYRVAEPAQAEIARRRALWFDPYHAAITGQIARLRALHPHIVLYDAHSIRSRVPRLFDGQLPLFNVGTNGATTCDPALTSALAAICAASGRSHVVDGRFRGGWTTRHYGLPDTGVHAVQMELAMRGYLAEPETPSPANWPPPLDPARAKAITPALTEILQACIAFAQEKV